MTQSIFSTLERLLRPKERLRFTITRTEAELVILLEPLLGSTEKDTPEAAAQARAALATPLRLQGTALMLDQDFERRLSQFGEARQVLGEHFEELLGALREAGNDAQAKTLNARRTPKPAKPADKEGVTKPNAAPRTPEPPAQPKNGATDEEASGKPLNLFQE